MFSEAKRVLVIEDASTAARKSAIRALLQSCSFRPGDKLMLLGVLQKRESRGGYRSRMDLSSIFCANQKIAGEELAMKKEEYSKDQEISSFSRKCKISEIDFRIEVQAGASTKEISVRAAIVFGATWIVLDKHMKKDKAYILERLSCRISAIKGNNSIKDLQRARATVASEIKLRNVDAAPFRIQWNKELENSICLDCRNRCPMIGWKRNFTYEELQAATEGFSVKNFITESGFGPVFRGKLNGMKVAVKIIRAESLQEEELTSLSSALSEAWYENLAMLLGICLEGNHRLLVYEYICNGSLELHLSKSHLRPLSWDRRMKIALGAARGLKSLHENKIVHGNFRPENILLSHDYEARVGDYGLSTAAHNNSYFYCKKTYGGPVYFAPEYVESGKASTQTDCYAFGVMLLQLITGLRTEEDPVLGGENLVIWAKPLIKDKNYPRLLDPMIGDSHDVHQLFWIVRVAERCLKKNPLARLPMDKVICAFEHLMEGNSVPVSRSFPLAKPESVSSAVNSSGSICDDKSSECSMSRHQQ